MIGGVTSLESEVEVIKLLNKGGYRGHWPASEISLID